MSYIPVFHRELIRAFALLLLCAATASASPQSDQQTLMRARQAYYNLKQAGLIEYRANVKPNWRVISGSEAGSESLKVLEQIRFSMWIDPHSKLWLDHDTDLLPTTDKSSEYYGRICKGMDEALSKFIATWSVFSLTSPFPQVGSDYELRQAANRYGFSHREGDTTVLTTADENFKVIEIKVAGAGFKASLRPELENTPQGFILTGYDASYQTNERVTRVQARLEYQPINGLQLPRKVYVDTIYEGKPAQVEWLFTDYQVKVR